MKRKQLCYGTLVAIHQSWKVSVRANLLPSLCVSQSAPVLKFLTPCSWLLSRKRKALPIASFPLKAHTVPGLTLCDWGCRAQLSGFTPVSLDTPAGLTKKKVQRLEEE